MQHLHHPRYASRIAILIATIGVGALLLLPALRQHPLNAQSNAQATEQQQTIQALIQQFLTSTAQASSIASSTATDSSNSGGTITPTIDAAAYDFGTAALYKSPDDILELKLPEGWAVGPQNTQAGITSFSFTAGADPQVAPASLQIKVGNAEALYASLAPTGNAFSPATALQAFIDASNSAATANGLPAPTFGDITAIQVGTIPGSGVLMTVPASATGQETDTDVYIAKTSTGTAIAVQASANGSVAPLAMPIFDQIIATIVLKPENIPTATTTPTVFSLTHISTQWQPTPAFDPNPTRTLVPETKPMIPYHDVEMAHNILNAFPRKLLAFTLDTDPQANYIGMNNWTGNVAGIEARYLYHGEPDAGLYVSIFITLSPNDAEDRFLFQYHNMNDHYGFPTTAGALGDESFVAPEVKTSYGDGGFVNAPIWGAVRLSNVEFDLYPTKALTDAFPNVTAADITTIQSAVLAAITGASIGKDTAATSTPTATTPTTSTASSQDVALTVQAASNSLNTVGAQLTFPTATPTP